MGSDSEGEKSVQRKKMQALAPIAKPLAGKKLSKKTLKLVKRAAENKCIKRGVKEVVKSIRRGQKGVCIIAGNISPIDVITHVPILCEDKDIPYVYVSSKEDLATAGATKRPTCCVLVMTKPSKGELSQEVQEKLKSEYDQVASECRELQSTLFLKQTQMYLYCVFGYNGLTYWQCNLQSF
uniref:H/ACA ribonucleoprotein complex subunit 2 n=1 Tax=Medicago truncatula TaxID=3880 RepID=I3S5G6_MEDTR|nr:unknown [Medicago truncatula]